MKASATVATINKAYITEATCKTIVSNSISSYFASLNSLLVKGNVQCYGITIGLSTFTPQTVNVRLASGATKLISYLGAF